MSMYGKNHDNIVISLQLIKINGKKMENRKLTKKKTTQTELNKGMIFKASSRVNGTNSETPKDRWQSEDISIPRPEGTQREENDTEAERELES